MEKPKLIYDSPSGKILKYILEQGEVTVKGIESGLNITRNAVRIQLDSLVAQGLVSSKQKKNERGRPYNVFYLTAKGRDFLPSQQKEMFGLLWSEINKITDPSMKEALLKGLGAQIAGEYESELRDLPEDKRMSKFIEILIQKEIPVELTENAESYTWNEYHCPYYQAAKDDPDVCKMDLDILQQILGKPIERNEWLHSGAYGCKFKMTKKQ